MGLLPLLVTIYLNLIHHHFSIFQYNYDIQSTFPLQIAFFQLILCSFQVFQMFLPVR